jgi:hypothetical protein
MIIVIVQETETDVSDCEVDSDEVAEAKLQKLVPAQGCT